MSEALIDACSCVLETKVVDRALPFHWTVESAAKFVPLTFSVKAGPPATAELGLRQIAPAGIMTQAGMGVPVGVGVGVVVGVADGVVVGVADGATVGLADGAAVGLGGGVAVAVGVGLGDGVGDEVAIGVGTTAGPNATADRRTACGLFWASSATISFPLTVLPLEVFAALVGLKVIRTSQVPPPPARTPWQSGLAVNPVPSVEIAAISSATGLSLIRLTISALDAPAWTLPKESCCVENSKAPLTPMPLKVTGLLLLPAVSVTMNVPTRLPNDVGAKVACTTQLPPDARIMPLQLFGSATAKSPLFGPPTEKSATVTGVAAFVLELEMVTVWGLLVAPEVANTSLPKFKLLGVTRNAL